MSRRRLRTWSGFLLAIALGFAALALLTVHVQRNARARAEATATAQRQEDVRTALYRMEQRFAPVLARAMGRTEVPGVLTRATSLQLDLGRSRALPITPPRPVPATLEQRARELFGTDLAPIACVSPIDWIDSNDLLGANMRQIEARGQSRTEYEWAQRQNAVTNFTNNGERWVASAAPEGADDFEVATGPLTVGWAEDAAGARQLVFVRAVEDVGGTAIQALWVDWATLQATLLAEVADLFDDASLLPLEGAEADLAHAALDEGTRLASFPARLDVPPLEHALGGDRTLRTTLWSTWALALAASLAAGFAFRASQKDAARQRRFTSAVTHELRTPLTTFRMYSEMLARGMVPPERAQEYLRALEDEAGRLGALVENVLAHARLEDGRGRLRREELSVAALLERSLSPLRRRCEDAGTALAVDVPDAVAALRLSTDPEAIALVLANLVDNAVKYGAGEAGHDAARPVHLEARRVGRTLALTVRDQGPGVPPAAAATIFRAFERAGRDESDAAPGVGLGLALARDLARSLGGELVLEPTTRGAAFTLTLDVAA